MKNLEEFCKRLEAAGQKFDRPYWRLPNSTTAIAFLTDPWGTYIELTENLAPPEVSLMMHRSDGSATFVGPRAVVG